MPWNSFWKKDPKKSIYEKRIDCLARLLDNQRITKVTDNEYLTVSIAEGKPHENALNRLGIYQTDYKRTYEQCKDILKP